MLSALIPSQRSYSAMQLAPQQQYTRGSGPTRSSRTRVSSSTKFLTPTTDRDRTVSRRSEPKFLACHFNGRTAQPLGPSSAPGCDEPDIEGAKPPRRRYELPWGGSACYPRRTFYPLSDGPFHAEPPDHYIRLSALFGLSASQSSTLMLLRSTYGYQAY